MYVRVNMLIHACACGFWQLLFVRARKQKRTLIALSHPMKLILLLLPFTLSLSACAPLAITAASIGGGAAAQHRLDGYAHRTFSEPLPKVRNAALLALKRMSIMPGSTEKVGSGEQIAAKAGDRNIEIEIEALTPTTTRLTAVAKRKGSFFVDSSTATEIVAQIEKAIRVIPRDSKSKDVAKGQFEAVALRGY